MAKGEDQKLNQKPKMIFDFETLLDALPDGSIEKLMFGNLDKRLKELEKEFADFKRSFIGDGK